MHTKFWQVTSRYAWLKIDTPCGVVKIDALQSYKVKTEQTVKIKPPSLHSMSTPCLRKRQAKLWENKLAVKPYAWLDPTANCRNI